MTNIKSSKLRHMAANTNAGKDVLGRYVVNHPRWIKFLHKYKPKYEEFNKDDRIMMLDKQAD